MSLYEDHIFPHLLELVSSRFDGQRRALFAEARGRVLEIGVGAGHGLDAYPEQVTDVVGLDPYPLMIKRAKRRLARLSRSGRRLPYRVHLHRADAQYLPYDDGAFDTVVAFLTLCTVPDAARAAREAYRVLKPDGRLLVLEHVRARAGRRLARWQDRLDPVWSRLAGGCHLNRDTAAVLAGAGFETSPLERYDDQRYFPPASPRIRGVIRGARAAV